MRLRLPLAAAATAAAAALLPAAAGAAPASAGERASAVPSAPTPARAWIGRLVVRTVARAAPRGSARVVTRLDPHAELGPTHYLVTRSAVRNGARWLEVLLAVRPNGRRGWVPADFFQLSTTAVRVTIDLSDRRLTVHRRNRVVMRAPVAVGRAGTPTPVGRRFAVAEQIRMDPRGFLGPVVLPLTGYSETLNEFAGGNGRVAIHGTSLPELIGTRASHGCVRMYNRDIRRLARLARAGTPVEIRR
ncbi:L,D-transpeptidase [Miltoncostaea marina]|uniref:L,D-transpeptidase n=1 Tax=Miltoncostaea marina TaxID=2843215 RepID=UPI001FE5B6E1|nr:L,D-transpeptidase [Miltoncostaea marina]